MSASLLSRDSHATAGLSMGQTWVVLGQFWAHTSAQQPRPRGHISTQMLTLFSLTHALGQTRKMGPLLTGGLLLALGIRVLMVPPRPRHSFKNHYQEKAAGPAH